MLNKLFTWCQGRHTAFAAFFALMGTVLQWFHRLDGSYVGLIGVLQGWVFAHSAQDDYFQKRDGGSDATR